jgi:uncharacterized membrane protein
VKGYIKINQDSGPGLFRKSQYSLIRLKPTTEGLPASEARVLNAVMGTDQTVKLSSLKGRSSLATELQQVRSQIGKDLKTRGYYLYSPTGLIRARWILPAVGLFALGFSLMSALTSTTIGIVAGAAALVLGIISWRVAGMHSEPTATGAAAWAKVEGFKLFLNVAEKDRLAFHNPPERTPELFSKLLPYAVALKVEKAWARQFAGIDVAPAVAGWYAGAALSNFSADSFTSDFSSNFGGAVSSNFAGSSGTGGAGGGGGGGGGGGW